MVKPRKRGAGRRKLPRLSHFYLSFMWRRSPGGRESPPNEKGVGSESRPAPLFRGSFFWREKKWTTYCMYIIMKRMEIPH